MPTFTVQQGMTPRNLAAVAGSIELCEVSPDGVAGCPPAGWVNIVVQGVSSAVGGVVTPDSAGQFAHPLFIFASQQKEVGKRRASHLQSPLTALQAANPGVSAAGLDLRVETDPGCYWIGSPCSIAWIGGTPGDVYDYSIQYVSTKQQRVACTNVDIAEPPFRFQLTSFIVVEGGSFTGFFAGSPPNIPQYHTHFEVVQGAAKISFGATAIPLDASYGDQGKVPLSWGPAGSRLTVSTGIYRTLGEF